MRAGPEAISSWNTFFSNWGTGSFKRLQLGGVGGLLFLSEQSLFDAYGSAWVAAQGEIQLGWLVHNAGGSTSNFSGHAADAAWLAGTVMIQLARRILRARVQWLRLW